MDEVLKELDGTSVGPEIREVVEAKNTPHGEAVQKFGLTCGMLAIVWIFVPSLMTLLCTISDMSALECYYD